MNVDNLKELSSGITTKEQVDAACKKMVKDGWVLQAEVVEIKKLFAYMRNKRAAEIVELITEEVKLKVIVGE